LKRIYLDTSLLVAALVHERGTAEAHRYLQDTAQQAWQISNWVISEFGSALGMKCRQGVISTEEASETWKRFGQLQRERLQLLTPEPTDFDRAARFCLSITMPIRAGDALHLAICQRQNSCLASFDRQLCAAAEHHHVPMQLLQIPN
jgi:predicted nucleic acid-binding protein